MAIMKMVLVLCLLQTWTSASVIRSKRQASMSGSVNGNINFNGPAVSNLASVGVQNGIQDLQALQQALTTSTNPTLATTIQQLITQLQTGNLNSIVGSTMAGLNPTTTTNLQQLQAVIQAIVNNGNTQFQPILTYLQTQRPTIATSLFSGFNINQITQLMGTLQTGLNQLLSTGTGTIGNTAATAANNLLNLVQSGQAAILIPALNAVAQTVGPAANVGAIINSLATQQAQLMPTLFVNGLSAINQAVQQATTNLQSAIGQSTNYFQGLAGLFGNTAQQMTGAAGNAVSGMTGPFASMATGISQALGQLMNLPTQLMSVPMGMLSALPQFLNILLNTPVQFISSLLQQGLPGLNNSNTGVSTGTGANTGFGLPTGSVGGTVNFG